MSEQIVIAAASLLGISILAMAALRGWQGWLAFKEHELERAPTARRHEIESSAYGGTAIGGARIEIADLKERIRKLEAIASGVDL